MKKLRCKSVLITGAGGGIGYFTALEFAKAGADLVLTDLHPKNLERTVEDCKKHTTTVLSYAVDVRSKSQVDEMAKNVQSKLGPLDILINNAGRGYMREFVGTSLDTWKNLIDINLWGPLYHIEAFLPDMIKRGSGHIVNVSSGQAFFRLPTWGAYSVTKLAVGGYSEILSHELAALGLNVTTVYPYLVNTGFYDDMATDTLGARLTKQYMRFVSNKPETVARKVFRAVVRKKRIEMVNALNYLGFYMHFIPFVHTIVSKIGYIFMARTPEELGGKSTTGRWYGFAKMIKEKRLGFVMDETMTGEHEFENGHGPAGNKFMEFTATWGTKHLTKWLNVFSPDFWKSDLSGVVTIEGLCKDAPIHGSLTLMYFSKAKIRYEFEFEVEGKKYAFVGEKLNIRPWNLHKSHTTCYGT